MDETNRRQTLPRFVESLMGIPLVLINVAFEVTHDGETCPVIPDPEGLEAAVAVLRATQPVKLGGQEIRFMRKALKLRAAELSQFLDVTAETMSRWENDREPISINAERILRLRIVHTLRDRAPGIKATADHVLDMKIVPFRLVNRPAALVFERRSVLRDGDEEEVWFFRGLEEEGREPPVLKRA